MVKAVYMRNICTVLFLNFLRSSKRPKMLLLGVASACILTLSGVSFAAFSLVHSSAATNNGEQANVVNDNGANQRANAKTNPGNPASSLPKKTINPHNGAANTKLPTPLQPSSSGSSAQSSALAGLDVKDVSLDPVTTVCTASQQTAYAIQTATVRLGDTPHASGVIRWYWEVRIDGGANEGESPISNQVYSQDITANASSVTLAGNQSDPLITAPTNGNYSYSFRLHIVSPSDVTSPWVSVPVVLDNGCQQ